MKRWTHIALGLTLTGALAVVLSPRPHEADELLLPSGTYTATASLPETVALRMIAKRLLAREAATGRRSLAEAAALFGALNRLPPEMTQWTRPGHPARPLPHLPGRTEDEVLCVQVIVHAGLAWRGHPPEQARADAAGLEEKYREELRKPGPIRLPDPSSLTPVPEILALARGAMTEAERQALLPSSARR
jgi:hypothetical protein